MTNFINVLRKFIFLIGKSEFIRDKCHHEDNRKIMPALGPCKGKKLNRFSLPFPLHLQFFNTKKNITIFEGRQSVFLVQNNIWRTIQGTL